MVGALTRKVDIREKPLYLERLEELLDGDLLFKSLLQCRCCVSLDYTRLLVETARLHAYLEATSDSGVEVRDLAENGLVHFPVAVSTDDGEVRKLSSLKEPRKLLEREIGRIGGFKTSKSPELT